MGCPLTLGASGRRAVKGPAFRGRRGEANHLGDRRVIGNLARHPALRQAELPNVRTFVTLSPVPGLAAWPTRDRTSRNSEMLDEVTRTALLLDTPRWHPTRQLPNPCARR